MRNHQRLKYYESWDISDHIVAVFSSSPDFDAATHRKIKKNRKSYRVNRPISRYPFPINFSLQLEENNTPGREETAVADIGVIYLYIYIYTRENVIRV